MSRVLPNRSILILTALVGAITLGSFAPAASAAASPKAVKIVAGDGHYCALMNNGLVKCWGLNNRGQLGNGTTTNSAYPVTVPGITNATQLALGNSHTCALLSTGSIKCWGANDSGQLGDGSFVSYDSSVYKTTPVTVSGITDAVQISAKTGNTCARFASGTIKCWGNNWRGQLGRSGDWGVPGTVTVSGISGPQLVSTGRYTSCVVLSSNGGVQCWGNNSQGEKANGDQTSTGPATDSTGAAITGVTQLTQGNSLTCVLLTSGTVKCSGYNEYGEIGLGYTCDCSIWRLTTVPNIGTATQVATGAVSGCATLSGGSVKCWGVMTDIHSSAFTVSGVSNPVDIAVGYGSACALLSTGSLKCWGGGSQGQLANGSFNDSESPVTADIAPVDKPTFTNAPSGTSNSRSLSFVSQSGSSTKCSVDGGAYVGCTSPVSLASLRDGAHTLSVKATIGTDTATSSVSWTVDRTVAKPVFSGVPSGIQTSYSGWASVSTEAGASLQCSRDGGAYEYCDTSFELAYKGDGSYTLAVKQTDPAGNVSAVSTAKWTVLNPSTGTSGDVNVHSYMYGSPGIWKFTGSPAYNYLWQRCSSPTDTSTCVTVEAGLYSSYHYTVEADLGKYLRFGIKIRLAGRSVETVWSPMSGRVVPTMPAVDTLISNSSSYPFKGGVVTARFGRFEGWSAVATRQVQWQRCNSDWDNCEDIAGATSLNYKVAAADVDNHLRVHVTVTGGAGVGLADYSRERYATVSELVRSTYTR